MEIFKETTGSIAILRMDHYRLSLADFLKLFEEAKKDFPGLKAEVVRVIHYGGQVYSGTFGIEFDTGNMTCPLAYKRIKETEFSL